MSIVGEWLVGVGWRPFRWFYERVLWLGVPAADQCAEITKIGAAFWSVNPDECDSLINRKAQAFWLLLTSSWAVIWLSLLMCRCLLLRPVLRDVKSIFFPSDASGRRSKTS